MIKHKGNFEKALKELKGHSATAHLYEKENNTKGPLSKVVVTVKDLYATADAPTQASSKILEGFRPSYDATIIKKLRESGASIIAKLHMDELALGGTGLFNAYGEILNPIDPNRLVGGSSSGCAATFTESIGISIGSDTGDSVRLPASYNGLYGFKPSYGAISRYGVFPYASSLDTVGYFAHNVDDIIFTSQVLFGEDEMDMTSKDVVKPENVSTKPKTIGVLKNDKSVPKYIIDKYKEFIELAKADGIEVKEFEIDQTLLDCMDIVYQSISYSEASSNDSNLTGISFGPGKDGKDWDDIMHKTRTTLFGELVQRRFTLGAYFLSNENLVPVFGQSQKVRRLIVDAFNKIKEQVDVLVFPATPIAPLIKEVVEKDWFESYLISSNFSGTPSMVVPWGKEKDMPFGLVIDGLLYKDKEVLSHSLYIDSLLGGKNA